MAGGEAFSIISLAFGKGGKIQVAFPAFKDEQIPDFLESSFNGVWTPQASELLTLQLSCMWFSKEAELFLISFFEKVLTRNLVVSSAVIQSWIHQHDFEVATAELLEGATTHTVYSFPRMRISISS